MKKKQYLYVFVTMSFALLFSSLNHASSLISISPSVQKVVDDSPIGDNSNVAVYDFIIRELLKAPRVSKKEIKKIEQEQFEILNGQESLKPLQADIVETPFSHILGALCAYKKNCRGIGIYQKDGLAIGLSTVKESYNPKKNYAVIIDPLSNLGVYPIQNKNNKYYEAIQAIYVDKENRAFLSFKNENNQESKLIGFLRHFFELK